MSFKKVENLDNQSVSEANNLNYCLGDRVKP
jgi:hypothetical protein